MRSPSTTTMPMQRGGGELSRSGSRRRAGAAALRGAAAVRLPWRRAGQATAATWAGQATAATGAGQATADDDAGQATAADDDDAAGQAPDADAGQATAVRVALTFFLTIACLAFNGMAARP